MIWALFAWMSVAGATTIDDDGDGFCEGPSCTDGSNPGDCDDTSANAFPGNTEVCDGVDNNCVGGIDEPGPSVTYQTWYADVDGDGHGDLGDTQSTCDGAPSGYVASQSDCDDTDPAVQPGASEGIADDVDQNCDGTELCYLDADEDTHGIDSGATVVSTNLSCTDPGESRFADDCVDSDPTIYEGAPEVFNDGIDQDCNGVDAEACFMDSDGDGVGVAVAVPGSGIDGDCLDPGESYSANDCNDGDPAIRPSLDHPDITITAGTEVCGDGVDSDCNGENGPNWDDDGDGLTWNEEQALGTDDCNADSDLDGVDDGIEESTGCMDPLSSDTDLDGVPDGEEIGDISAPRNTDATNGSPYLDALIDACDTDDDGDTIPTVDEVGSNSDTLANLSPDLQAADAAFGIADDIPDHLDADDDGDSVFTWNEDVDGDGDASNDDSDGDLTPDYLDPDDDDDFIETWFEELLQAARLDEDGDGDGVLDDEEWGCPVGVCDGPWSKLQPRNTDVEANNGDGAWACIRNAQNPSAADLWQITLGAGDGLIDAVDADDDNDGLPTGLAGVDSEGGLETDSDGDGTPDFRDLDSDDDSFISLVIDLQGNTVETNNRPDACERDDDWDNDTIPNYVDANDFDGLSGDPDGDRLSTELELELGTSPSRPDSDSDGVLDCEEARPVGFPALCPGAGGVMGLSLAAWIDGGLQAPDTDGDGVWDVLDSDDDQDGIATSTEVFQLVEVSGALGDDIRCAASPDPTARPELVWADPDGDAVFEHLYRCAPAVFPGEPTFLVVDADANDTDGDGTVNRLDPDDDGDGRPTVEEDVDGNGSWFDSADDTDGDGILQFLDSDDFDGPVADADLDGLTNAEEQALCDLLELTPCDLQVLADADGDGLLDSEELDGAGLPVDSDGDGLADLLDPDDDDDCIPTELEGTSDQDGDGLGAHLDPDSDEDGLGDTLEWFGEELQACPEEVPPALDVDGNGVPDVWERTNRDSADTGSGPEPSDGCACASSSRPGSALVLLGLAALFRFRRGQASRGGSTGARFTRR